MAGDSLISAFHSEYGDEEENWANRPVNLKNIAAQLKLWLEGAQLDHLPAHLEQMRARVMGGALSVQKELQKKLTPELKELFESSLQDYVDLLSFLEELGRGLTNGDRQLVRNELVQLRASTNSLMSNERAIRSWLEAPVARCPRCGAAARDNKQLSCPECKLELLYPDPKGPGKTRNLVLPQQFKAVHDLYQGIVKGETSLSRLAPALEPLRQFLNKQADLAESHLTYDEELSRSLEVLAGAARTGLQGVKLLEGLPRTRRTTDLHEGWRLIFEAGAELQGQLPTVAKAAGIEAEDNDLDALTRDSIILRRHDD